MVYDFGGFMAPGVLSIPKECDYEVRFIADKSGYIAYTFIFAYTGFWGDFLGGVHGCSFRGYYMWVLHEASHNTKCIQSIIFSTKVFIF